MPKCILHVGMHKTGSTSIQNSLKELDDDEFYYARLRDRPNHSITVSMIFAKPDDPRLNKKRFSAAGNIREQAKKGRRELNVSVKAANGRNLVISGEGILRMPVEDLQKLKNYLNRHGYDEIEVVAYIRPPVGYISSAVQQKIRMGKSGNLQIAESAPDYEAKFSKFDRVFGAENVRLFKFDPISFLDRNVVADFCAKTAISLSSIVPVRMNESISRLAAQLLFQYTAHAEVEGLRPLRGAMGAALCSRLLPLDPTRFRLAPSAVKPIVDRLRSDIEWMEKRLGQTLLEDLRDEAGDVRTEEDVLTPVPGITEKLQKILAEDGETVPDAVANNTWKLLYMIAQSARDKHQNESLNQDGEGGMAVRWAALEEDRRNAAGNPQRRQRNRKPSGAALYEVNLKAGRQSERRAERKVLRHGGRPGEGTAVPQEGRGAGKRQGRATGAQDRGPKRQLRLAAFALDQDNANFRIEEFDKAQTPAAAEMALPPPPAVRHSALSRSDVVSTTQRPQAPTAMTPKEQQLMRSLRAMAKTGGRKAVSIPLTMGPTPLVNKDKKLIVLWSPKSACTTMYVWFSHISGFAEDVRKYATWPHRHRMDQYMKSKLYAESVDSGMTDAKVLRVIRDPYGRAVSIYRHALQTLFADRYMEAFSNGRIDAKDGYSFQTFLDLLEQLDMRRVDVHFRPQFHPLEKTRAVDRVINISKSDLFTEINAFEAMMEIPKTNFEDLNWLHALETKRKAKQEPIEGDGLDQVPFSRQQAKMGQLPSYGQLLTPLARQRIEAIYKADFDAYRDYL